MLLILVATFALILLSQFFLFKKKPDSPPAEQATPAAKSQAATPPATAAAKATETPSPTPAQAQAASAETETVVENDLYRIVFTNRGAQVKSWILKKYKDEKGQPLDLVNPATVNFGLPLGLYTYDEALRGKINSALYVATSGASGESSRRCPW